MRLLQAAGGASLNTGEAARADGTEIKENAGGPAKPVGGRRIAVLAAVAVTAYLLDLVTKIITVRLLEGREPIELLGGLLTLRVIRNPGAAFSIGTGLTLVLSLIAIGVVIAIVRTARRLRSTPWAISLGLLLGGALGNLTDRIFRAPGPLEGHVVDWIELPNWPVFNVADSAIVCGGILAVVLAWRGVQLDGTRETRTTSRRNENPHE
ncbi:signal peptidase II [Rhizohabitans arisaemae]|uniref:signal peptidase II n=1 Tax=Rhizohabitans arisaemae TaxID=2720610 RepID=UPI003D160D53